MVCQSDWLPMMTPTKGFLARFAIPSPTRKKRGGIIGADRPGAMNKERTDDRRAARFNAVLTKGT